MNEHQLKQFLEDCIRIARSDSAKNAYERVLSFVNNSHGPEATTSQRAAKPYFAKWLPVEGEIKEGDWVLSAHKDPNLSDYLYHLIGEELALYQRDCKYYPGKKVKLFLCSRDIQVGDKVWSQDKGFFEADQMLININTNAAVSFKYPPIKVIGEISPNALSFVKEGDEFDKEDISLPSTTKRLSSIPWFVMIKGPCGHFH